MTERLLSVEKFKEDDSQGPDIDFGRYFRVEFFESFGREVIIGASALGSEIDACFIALHDFAESEVKYFDHSLVEHHVAGLQVVMDDLLIQFGEVVEGREELLHDEFGFLFL